MHKYERPNLKVQHQVSQIQQEWALLWNDFLNIDDKSFVSLMKRRSAWVTTGIQITWIRLFYKVSKDQNKPLNMKKDKASEIAGKVPNIYISFLFQTSRGIGKQNLHSEELCTKCSNALSSWKKKHFKGKKKDLPHDLTVFVILCKGKYWHLPDCLLQLSDLLQFIFITTLSMGLLLSSLGLTELSRFVTTASSSCYRTSKTS